MQKSIYIKPERLAFVLQLQHRYEQKSFSSTIWHLFDLGVQAERLRIKQGKK